MVPRASAVVPRRMEVYSLVASCFSLDRRLENFLAWRLVPGTVRVDCPWVLGLPEEVPAVRVGSVGTVVAVDWVAQADLVDLWAGVEYSLEVEEYSVAAVGCLPGASPVRRRSAFFLAVLPVS